MSSTGPDFYRRRLATSIEDWNECKAYPRVFGPLRQKARLWSRIEKHRARAMDRVEIASAATLEALSADACENGSCPFCHDGGYDTDFERTRMAAAQRGAI